MRTHLPVSGTGLPPVRTGQAVGLLGGSFDPPHAGHVQLTEQALKRFGLDRVWWLVSPGNPLKPEKPAPLTRRLEAAHRAMKHPKVTVSDIEMRAGTEYTADTLAMLHSQFPGTRFVWLMGTDNLAEFHRWHRWREIFRTVPIGVITRPSDIARARHCKAAKTFSHARLRDRQAPLLPTAPPPAWCLVNVPMLDLSSEAIRNRGEWIR